MAGGGASGRHLIGINVVVFAVSPESERRENRNAALLPQRFDPAGLGKADFTDESEIISSHQFLAGAEGHAVSAAEADSRHSGSLNRSHHSFVDQPAEHHEGDIASFRVGDPKAAHKLALFPEPLQHLRQRPAAAMYHGHAMAILSQFSDRFGALAQNESILERRSTDFDYDCHCSPSSSAQPYIRFMFCTACPAAPFSRLSMQEISTNRRPSSARQNPRSQ